MFSSSKDRLYSEQSLLGLKKPQSKVIEIVRQSKQERAERLKRKQEQNAATTIQAWWRGCVVRHRLRREWRLTWDRIWLPRLSNVTSPSQPPITALELFQATRLLCAFYTLPNTTGPQSPTKKVLTVQNSECQHSVISDDQRMNLLLDAILKSTFLDIPFNYIAFAREDAQQHVSTTSVAAGTVISPRDWAHQVTKLLCFALQRCAGAPPPAAEFIETTLRLTLILTSASSPQTQILLIALLRRGLFGCLRELLARSILTTEQWVAACRTLAVRAVFAVTAAEQPITSSTHANIGPLSHDSADFSSFVVRTCGEYFSSLLTHLWPEHELAESDMLAASTTALQWCMDPSSGRLVLSLSQLSSPSSLTMLRNLTLQLRAILTSRSSAFTPFDASLWLQAFSILVAKVLPLPALSPMSIEHTPIEDSDDGNEDPLKTEVEQRSLSLVSPSLTPTALSSDEVLAAIDNLISLLFCSPHCAVTTLCSLIWSTASAPSSDVPFAKAVPPGIVAVARLSVHLLSSSLLATSSVKAEHILRILATSFAQPLPLRLLHCSELLHQSYESLEWDELGLTHVLIVSAQCLHAVLSEADDRTVYSEEESLWPISVIRELSALLHRLILRLYDASTAATFSSHTLFFYLRDAVGSLLRPLHDHSVRHAYLRGTSSVSNDALLLPPPTLQLRTDTDVQMYAHNLSWLRLLSACPFLLTTHDKVKLLHVWLREERERVQQSSEPLHIQIRRSHLLQDAFQRLNTLRRDLRRIIRIEFINREGLAEAGIDGGGLFRELITEVIKTVFSPNYGLFIKTPGSEEWLYPNPSSSILLDNDLEIFAFLGRLIGKCLFEECLVDVPLAPFFLALVLERPVHVWQLEQLDPELYTHLVSLRKLEGPIENLDLTFTIIDDITNVERCVTTPVTRVGATATHNTNAATTLNEVELVPGGKNIIVTKDNLEEYIRAIARYRLYTQIAAQAGAFRQGFLDLINAEWLRLLGCNEYELAILISGTNQGLDLADFQQNVVYAGGYHPTHPVILNFWEVVKEFTPHQQSLLLRFATSSSRPPLLGFAYLNPKFCIKLSSLDDSFLPSANTCMNLLKLPAYSTKERLREKLLYAITSNSGFDLS